MTASATSASTIRLAWADGNSNETGYEVQRAAAASGPFATVSTTQADATGYTDDALTAATTYYYRVRTVADDRTSNFSVPVSATTLPESGPPVGDAFVVYLNFTQSGYEAASPWNNLTAPPTQQPTYSGIKDEQGQMTTISIQSLTDWSAFHDNTGQGSAGMTSGLYPTNVVQTYFFADAGSTEQLRLRGLPGGYAYRFTFFASRDGGGDRTTTYRINGESVSLNAAYNTNQTVTLDEVYPDASDEILLELVTPASSSFGYLNALVLEAYDPNALRVPDDLVATATGSQIVLGWSDNNAEETGYQIERRASSTGAYELLATTEADITTYVDADVAEGTPYFYRLRATDGSDYSAYGNEASATLGSGGGGVLQTLYLNFTQNGFEAASPWNNLTAPPTQQPTYSGMLDEQGQATNIRIESLTNWSAFHDNTSQGSAGMTTGLYPADVVKTYFFADAGSTEQLQFSGLDPAQTYRFTFFGSRDGGGDRTTTYRIGDQQASLNAAYNTTNTVTLSGVRSQANGQLLLEIVTPSSSPFGYLNALVLEAYDPAAPTDNAPPVIAARSDTLPVGSPYQQTIRATAGGGTGLGEWVVVLGSSTAVGNGASGGQSWVARLQAYLGKPVSNLAVGGYTTRDVLPSGNPQHNITQALSLNPTVILVNLPSNDVADGISDQESMDNFAVLRDQAQQAGVPIYFTTTQPRNFGNAAQRQRLAAQAAQMQNLLAPRVISIYDELADNNNRIAAQYSSGDGVHLNDAGHGYIFAQVQTLVNALSANPDGNGNNEGISLTVSGLPPFLSFSQEGPGEGTLAGTPTAADIGSYDNIEITATDAAGRSSTQTIALTVAESDLADEVPGEPLAFRPQWGGNVAAMVWSTFHYELPVYQQAYTYDYSQANRLTEARYASQDTDGGWTANQSNYSVHDIGYDANGNITGLTRYTADPVKGTPVRRLMDQLSYTYAGNRVRAVSDAADAELGFADGASNGSEYGYDANGNLTRDDNKGITNIAYDAVLDVPLRVDFADGARIDYLYDAAGNRLAQTITAVDGTRRTTDYVGAVEYRDDQLALIHHPEGRVVPKTDGSFVYHYDLRDHLGNVRLTFSEEPMVESSDLTMETPAAPTEEALFEHVAAARQTLAFHNTTDASREEPQPNKVARLQAGQTGPAKSLSVRAGDKVHLQVNAAYETGRGKVQGLEGIATQVAGAASRSAAGLESAGAITGSNGLAAGSALTNGKQQGVPPAYLNYLVYDTDYQLVDQGFVQVSEAAAVEVGSTNNDPAETLTLDVDIARNGYLYAYLSHDVKSTGSPSATAVYFDDFTVEHEGISIVQHNDYYAFGAVYQQSADRVLSNRYLYQGKELQDGLGFDLYDFHARQYDPFLGRFTSIDPAASSWDGVSPYAGMLNNPVSYVDPDGRNPIIIGMMIGGTAGFGIGYASGLRGNELVASTLGGMALGAGIGFGVNGGFAGFGQGVGGVLANAPNAGINLAQQVFQGVGPTVGADGVLRLLQPGTVIPETVIRPMVQTPGGNWANYENFRPRPSPYRHLDPVRRGMAEQSDAFWNDPVMQGGLELGSWLAPTGKVFGVAGKLIGKGVAKMGSKVATRCAPRLLNQFNSVESLLQRVTTSPTKKGALQGFIRGDGEAIFRSITQGAQRMPNGTYKFTDGTTLFKHFSTNTGHFTIDINRAGAIYKIRIMP